MSDIYQVISAPVQIDLVIRRYWSSPTAVVPGKEEETLAEIEVKQGVKCEECEEVAEEGAGVPLYECGSCSTIFAGHEGNRCPDCNKFASKIGDEACAVCEQGPVEFYLYVECPLCGETIAPDDLGTHISGGC